MNTLVLEISQGITQAQPPLESAAALGFLAAVLAYSAFRVWFAVVKIRERRLLGNMAVANSAIELLTVGWFVASFLDLMTWQELMIAAMVLDGGQGILRFSWFYMLRERADQPPPLRKEYFWDTPLHEVDWDAENQW
jgi:hypothetical protein